ncbi:hypothetical protein TNCV_112331 [Trichonephila clavipes]|nr:hypothetical protein TNCV_112331 [Trichonephila clavipes]
MTADTCVLVLVSLKIHRIEILMDISPVVAQILHIGVERKSRELGVNSDTFLITRVQNCEVCHPRISLEWNASKNETNLCV